jgi:ketosteroid isomerase-like protein
LPFDFATLGAQRVSGSLDPIALFSAIDRMDSSGFAGFLTADASLRFGNAPVVAGRDAVVDYIDGFFRSIGGLAHRVEGTWQSGDRVTCHGEVTYTRHDGSTLTVPFANVLYLEGGRIRRYLIYIDNTSLYADG